jgi:hypothetical protein
MSKENTPVTPAELEEIRERMYAAGQIRESMVIDALLGSIYRGGQSTKKLVDAILPFVQGELSEIVRE